MAATFERLSLQSVLVEQVPMAARTRTALVVVGGALLTAAASQVRIPLGFTPVPVNGLTFATLFLGAAFGARRGLAAVGLFWLLGAVGLPFYSEANGGWDHATGATGGYLLGAVAAAGVMGLFARLGGDRRLATSLVGMVVVNVALIWVPGTLWLAHVLDVPVFGGDGSAFALGIRPFVLGDLAKVALAGSLLPLGWRLAGDAR